MQKMKRPTSITCSLKLHLKHRWISSTAYTSQNKKSSKKESTLPTFTLTRTQRAALRLVEDDSSQSKRSDEQNTTNHPKNQLNHDEKLNRTVLDLKRQAQEQEALRSQQSPLPWYSLLLHPSQASWRSSPQPPPSYIQATSQDTIKVSERTSKQLKRTQDRIVTHYSVMSERRERERRNMVQSANTSSATGNSSSTYNKTSILHKKINHKDKSIKSTYYKPEYAIANMKYRLVPNYCILKRILKETQSLLGPNLWFPKHVLDVGMGIGSASAATLDFFFEMQQIQKQKQKHYPYKESTYQGIEWIHGIEPSQSMKDAASILLQSVIEGHSTQEQQQEDVQQSHRLERNKIRFTMEHGIVPTSKSSSTNASSTNQSFDLALCSYTLCEIPSVPAALSMSAMIWEKLRPGGVAIFVEPGTPDGFNALRSVRNMLLDCCPPPENVNHENDDDDDDYDAHKIEEECHVIAPCTHNGTCPMVRHRKNFRKYNPDGNHDDGGGEEGHDDDELLSMDQKDWNDDDVDYVDDEDDGNIEYEDDWDEEEDEYDETEDESISLESKAATSSTNTTTSHAFETAFCSFVHGMPGKEQGNQGEKFSYLVVQKRLRVENETMKDMDVKYNPFHNVNLVELLKESMDRKDVVSSFQQKLSMKEGSTMDHPSTSSSVYLENAVRVEDEYLDSTLDGLGLELVRGENRSDWGRIVRAPIKKKGHVIIDYCSNMKSNRNKDNENDEKNNGTENVGVIHRLMVTKSQSSKSAPGMYSSSRKARWGGFWPDVKSNGIVDR